MSLDLLLVSGIMKTDVKTENENHNIVAVCKVMHDNNIGCVVVVKMQDKEKIPVEIITERDIVPVLGKLAIKVVSSKAGIYSQFIRLFEWLI